MEDRILTLKDAASVASTTAGSSSKKFVTPKGLKEVSNLRLSKNGDTLTNVKELVNVIAGAANNTTNIDTDTALIWYFTSTATANWTRNFRASATVTLNSRMAIGESISLAIMITQGATAYLPSSYTIDGNAITPKWANGYAPTSGNINGIDVVYVTIIKRADATFTMLKSLTNFA